MGCCEGKPSNGDAGTPAGTRKARDEAKEAEIDDLRRQIGELTKIVQQQQPADPPAHAQMQNPLPPPQQVKALPQGVDDDNADMVADTHGINLLGEVFGAAPTSHPSGSGSYSPPPLAAPLDHSGVSSASPPSVKTAADAASGDASSLDKAATPHPPLRRGGKIAHATEGGVEQPSAVPAAAEFTFAEEKYEYEAAAAAAGVLEEDAGLGVSGTLPATSEGGAPRERVRTIMVIGETGSGKSTLLNAMANWAAGVGYDTPTRYRLVHEAERSQAFSQTQNVMSYQVACGKFSYTLRLIDTPGFGDTSGVERDDAITKDIYDFLQNEDEIHAVCFVAAASLPRLTVTQQYIINKVLTMFGSDAVANIFLLITFADGKKAQVLNAIEASGFPYRPEHSFHFNNSALYTKGADRNEYSKHFWAMGEASMNRFFEVLATTVPFNLTKTKDVISTQKKLQNYVASITPQVSVGLSKIDNLRSILKDIKENRDKINENKNYTYTETIPKVTRQKKKPGMYNTQCLKCSYDCHHDCTRSNDADKRFCCAMDPSGHCTVCPEKCHWSDHANLDYYFEWTTQTVTRQYDTKKLQLSAATQGLSRSEALKNSILEELQTVYDNVRQLMTSIHQAHAKLDEIALRPTNLQFVDYLKLLIEQEKLHKRAGFEGRIEQLHIMLEQAKIQSDIVSNKFDPIADWRKNIEAELGGGEGTPSPAAKSPFAALSKTADGAADGVESTDIADEDDGDDGNGAADDGGGDSDATDTADDDDDQIVRYDELQDILDEEVVPALAQVPQPQHGQRTLQPPPPPPRSAHQQRLLQRSGNAPPRGGAGLPATAASATNISNGNNKTLDIDDIMLQGYTNRSGSTAPAFDAPRLPPTTEQMLLLDDSTDADLSSSPTCFTPYAQVPAFPKAAPRGGGGVNPPAGTPPPTRQKRGAAAGPVHRQVMTPTRVGQPRPGFDDALDDVFVTVATPPHPTAMRQQRGGGGDASQSELLTTPGSGRSLKKGGGRNTSVAAAATTPPSRAKPNKSVKSAASTTPAGRGNSGAASNTTTPHKRHGSRGGAGEVSQLLGLEYSDAEGALDLGDLDSTPQPSPYNGGGRAPAGIATPSSTSRPPLGIHQGEETDSDEDDTDDETDSDMEVGPPIDFFFKTREEQEVQAASLQQVQQMAARGYGGGTPLPPNQSPDIQIMVRPGVAEAHLAQPPYSYQRPGVQTPHHHHQHAAHGGGTVGGMGIVPAPATGAAPRVGGPTPMWAQNIRVGQPPPRGGSAAPAGFPPQANGVPYTMVV